MSNSSLVTQKQALSALRAERRRGAAMLIDVSSSMNACDTMGGLRRIDHLGTVMTHLLQRVRLQSLIAFSTAVYHLPLQGTITIPEPQGVTNLWCALEEVKILQPTPTRCIVLCDGEFSRPEQTVDLATTLRPMPIDAYFVGNDRDYDAIKWMERLSAAGGPGGRHGHFNLGDHYRLTEEIVLAITDQRGSR